ncbi:galectin-2-like [Heterodontus francisci]|uniref:galectin-2-like n=1 Tax=Heterodontus francisci TaxID=7792 RepID=UPI00355C9069
MSLELHNMVMKCGDVMKITGTIPDDAERFAVNMGSSTDQIGLHFNPRFNDGTDGEVIICNSKRDGCWDSEQRDSNFPFSKGVKVKFSITFKGDNFEIQLPNDHKIEFPNRLSLVQVTYISVHGDFKLTSFKCS